MRKLSILIFTLLLLGIVTVNAQELSHTHIRTTWGVNAEANLSNFYMSHIQNAKSTMNVGFTAGANVNIDFTKHFALRVGLGYNYKNSDYKYNGVNGEYQHWGMEIPVYAIAKWDLPNKGRIYCGGGPYTEFILSATVKKGGTTTNLTKIAAFKESNNGFGIIVGYELPSGLQFNAGYKLSVTNILDENSSNGTLLPATISFGIGFRFGKNR